MALSNAFVEKKSPAMTSEQAVTALIPLLITFIWELCACRDLTSFSNRLVRLWVLEVKHL